MRDNEQGDLADNRSNAMASMMGWLCTKTAKAHPGSPVANIMDTAEVLKDGHHHGDGIKMDSKKLHQAWVFLQPMHVCCAACADRDVGACKILPC